MIELIKLYNKLKINSKKWSKSALWIKAKVNFNDHSK